MKMHAGFLVLQLPALKVFLEWQSIVPVVHSCNNIKCSTDA